MSEEISQFNATTKDGLVTLNVIFHEPDADLPAETIAEMVYVLESMALNLKLALENPEIRHAEPVGGKES